MRISTGRIHWGIGVLVASLALQGCQRAERPAGEQEAGTPQRSSGESAAPKSPAPSQAAPATAAAQPRTATLAAGTALQVRTTNTVSTKSHKAGDTFTATLEAPLVSGDWVIAAKGATVEGRVVESDPGGRVRGVASMGVALNRVNTPDGQEIKIATNTVTIEAQSTKAKDATKIAIGTGIGAAVGALAGGQKGAAIGAATGAGAGTAVVLSTRGDAAEIGSETVLNFQLSSPVTVTEAK